MRDNFGLTKRLEPKEGEPSQTRTMFYKRAYECDGYAYCVFASDDVITAIHQNTEASERKIYADGTFKICPIGKFKQVLILFAELLGHVSAHIFAHILDLDFLKKLFKFKHRSFRLHIFLCHTKRKSHTKQYLLTSI